MVRQTALGILVLLLAQAGCASWFRDKDEKAIRAIVEGMRTSAQLKQFERTLEPVSGDYQDNLRQDREMVLNRLNRVFADYERLAIRCNIEKVERNGMLATAFLRILVFGIRNGQKELVFGNPLSPSKVQLYFDKRMGTWKVTGSLIEQH